MVPRSIAISPRLFVSNPHGGGWVQLRTVSSILTNTSEALLSGNAPQPDTALKFAI